MADGGRDGARRAVSFDRVADDYDATRGGEVRAANAAHDIGRHLPPGTGPASGADVLEIGVGTGIVARALLEHVPAVHHVVGVDISAQMLARAAQRLPGSVLRASALELPLTDDRFDAVVAVHILHLVTDLGRTLAEAARVLRPGGRVVALHGQPEHDEDDELTVATRPLRSAALRRPDTAAAVREAGTAAGLVCVGQEPATPQTASHSPNALADLISRRTWSYLWALDDDQWQQLAVPVIAALRALPDPDRPRPQEGRTWLTVLEKPMPDRTSAPSVR